MVAHEDYEMSPSYFVSSSKHDASRLSKPADEAELARFGKKQQLQVCYDSTSGQRLYVLLIFLGTSANAHLNSDDSV